MGMYSWNCKVCGHPLLAKFNTNGVNEWMSNVVIISEDNEVLIGEYDGYGRITSVDDVDFIEAEAYHKHCWELAGKPTTFTDFSDSAEDQGHFFNDGDHDIAPPEHLPDDYEAQ